MPTDPVPTDPVPTDASPDRMPAEPDLPVPPLTAAGTPRRVGVEIEFGALDARAAARLAQQQLGGEPRREDRHRVDLVDSALGDLRIELDSSYAHPTDAERRDRHAAWWTALRGAIGDVAALWLPYEITTPPLAPERLPTLDALCRALRAAGAAGTDDSVVYAFGLHLNPELAAPTAAYLLRMLRAYLVLSPLLRAQTRVELSRQLAGWAKRFPAPYERLVLAAEYAPDLSQLAADYAAHNPTRHRELDLLPALAELAPGGLPDDLAVSAPRPTFHYRLPNAGLSDPAWTVTGCWNRWVQVERLAADERRLARLAAARLGHLERWLLDGEGEWVRILADRHGLPLTSDVDAAR